MFLRFLGKIYMLCCFLFLGMIGALYEDLRRAIISHSNLKENIYDVNDLVCAKRNSLVNTLHDFYVASYLSKRDFPVPEIHGFVDSSVVPEHPFFNYIREDWFLVMEYVKGTLVSKLDDYYMDEVEKQYVQYATKALDYNICLFDSNHKNNLIFDEDEEKLYFIDFSSWEFGKKDELDLFRTFIENFRGFR